MSTKIINEPYPTSNGESVDIRHEILTSELGNQMLDMVAPTYDRSKVALYLFQALGTEFQPIVDFVLDDFIKQIFPQTATWGLDYWEEEYGIITDKSKTIEERRAYFMGLKFYRPSTTPKRIEKMVTSFTGFDCVVDEGIAPNTFRVTIYGYPKNIKSVKDLLNQKSQAHLIYELKGIERAESVSDTFPIVTGNMNLSESLGVVGVSDYTFEAEKIDTASNTVFQAIACGNIAETFGEIEVMN